jgi:hypothetical protein
MFGFNNSFKVGNGVQLKYQVGGTSNILSNRNNGVVRKVGISKRGAYVLVTYRCSKTGSNRIANFSTAKMIDPVIFSS